MVYDPSDTLDRDMRTVQPAKSSLSWYKMFLLAIFLAISYEVGRRIYNQVLLWREKSYRLATRRRHGIPDDDLRPFNVAYSAARIKMEEQGKRNRIDSALRPQPHPQEESHNDGFQSPSLRQRSGNPAGQRSESSMMGTMPPIPGGYITSNRPSASYDSNRRPAPVNTKVTEPNVAPRTPRKSGLTRRGALENIDEVETLSVSQGKKPARGNKHDSRTSRNESDDPMDDDEDDYEEYVYKRGSKRVLGEEEDYVEDSTGEKKTRGKRARNFSNDKLAPVYDMEVDDEEGDELSELHSSYRGKKRDRTEAGSLGAEEDDDSDQEDPKNRSRRRKRRTVAKRKSEISYNRDKQRRKDEGEEEDYSSSDMKKHKRKARHSSHIPRREHKKSDVSMDESISSLKSKIREIGDIWLSNGVKYMIGPNGQRLREALVWKERQKFVMPEDSQHPDKSANLRVCVEVWLTEEEYQEVKSKRQLVWQNGEEEAKKFEEAADVTVATPGSPDSVPFPTDTGGKALLWNMTSTPPLPSPSLNDSSARNHRNGPRHSVATSNGLPNAYQELGNSKRIVSTPRMHASPSPHYSHGLKDSTNGALRTPGRIYSKWEKQEREAEAIMKLRESSQKARAEREAKEKEDRENADREERQKAERERLERERSERERVEKERAEKAREAAEKAAAVPQITVTAPSTNPSTNFSPTNFFGLPPKNPEQSQPQLQPQTQQPSNIFSVSKPSTTTAPHPPPSFPSTTTASTTAHSGSALKFAFNAANDTATTPSFSATQPTQPQPSQQPTSFFPVATPSTAGQQQQKNDVTNSSATSGPSLLNRMGPPAPPTSQPQMQTQAQTAPNPNPFSIKPPDTNASAGQTTASTSGAPTTGGSNPTAPKFNFGFPKPTTTTNSSASSSAPPVTASTGSASANAWTGNSQKFNFGAGGNTSSSSSGAASGTKFNFGVASSTQNKESTKPQGAFAVPPSTSDASSAFSSNAAASFGGQTQGKEKEKEHAKVTFGGSKTISPFGPSSSQTGKSVFGSSGFSSGAFGATSNATENKEPIKSPFDPPTNSPGNPFAAAALPAKPTEDMEPAKSMFGAATTFTAPSATSGQSAFGALAKQEDKGPAQGLSSTSPFAAFANSGEPAKQNVFGGGTGFPGPSTENKEASKAAFGFSSSSPFNVPAKQAESKEPAKSAFGGVAFPTSSAFGTAENKEPSKSFFSGAGASGSGSGNTSSSGFPSTTPTSSPFGATPAQQSVFGNLNSAGSNKPTGGEVQKPLFNFGNPAPTFGITTTPSKALGEASTTPFTTPASGSTFNFGPTAASQASTFAAAAASGSMLFGGSGEKTEGSTPSMFGPSSLAPTAFTPMKQDPTQK